jgi:protein-tyrosine phosphatase
MFRILRKKRLTIVIVCSANITRSPFFAGYLKKLIQDRLITEFNDLEIISAGTEAVEGTPANPVIKNLATLYNFSLLRHRSQCFNKRIARKANLVLTMENKQKNDLLDSYPKLNGHIFTVRDFGKSEPKKNHLDIPDPTGLEVEDFQEFLDVAIKEAQRVLNVLWVQGLDTRPAQREG